MKKTTCFSDDSGSSGGGYVIYELLTKQVWNGKKKGGGRGTEREEGLGLHQQLIFLKAFAFTTVTKEQESGYYFSPFK